MLHGEDYLATLRIDDDDFDTIACAETSAVSAVHPFYPHEFMPDIRGTPAQEDPLPNEGIKALLED